MHLLTPETHLHLAQRGAIKLSTRRSLYPRPCTAGPRLPAVMGRGGYNFGPPIKRMMISCMNSGTLPTGALPWAPHDLSHYDADLTRSSEAELQRLATAGSANRLDFLMDPRAVHRRLYASLAPATHPEYAGTYRGTPGTTLEFRRSGVPLSDGVNSQIFAEPNRVAHYMESVGARAKTIFDLAPNTPAGTVLTEIARLFYVIGMTHPFLDGNGHIQRLAFAACVIERDVLRLSPDWTIHPRPYDVEMRDAFETPTSTAARIGAVREVLRAYVS